MDRWIPTPQNQSAMSHVGKIVFISYVENAGSERKQYQLKAALKFYVTIKLISY